MALANLWHELFYGDSDRESQEACIVVPRPDIYPGEDSVTSWKSADRRDIQLTLKSLQKADREHCTAHFHEPHRATCAQCGMTAETIVVTRPGAANLLASLGCAFVIPFGVFALPKAISSKTLADVTHECAVCGTVLGESERI